MLLPELDVLGEDCLTLNVWSPELPAAGLPVMVWITGGAFEHGTAAVPDTLDTEPTAGPAPPQPLAEAMHAAWVAFVTTGDPGWPAYDLARRATMRFDTTSEVVDDPTGSGPRPLGRRALTAAGRGGRPVATRSPNPRGAASDQGVSRSP